MVPPVQAAELQPQVASLPQLVPQPPQFIGSEPLFVSQPLPPKRSQSRRAPLHAAHPPLWQYCDVEQLVGQLPQCRLSVLVSTSHPVLLDMSQSAVGGGQLPAQVPLAQMSPPEQGELQPPQCALVVFVSVSQPVARSSSQLPHPASHPTIAQTPDAQPSSAFGSSQGWLHPPQLATSSRLVSQPLFGFESQSS